MSRTLELLTAARDLYAANPSHAAPPSMPEHGTHCVITALCTARERLDFSLADEESALAAIHAQVSSADQHALSHLNARLSTDDMLAILNRAIAVVAA